MNRLVMPILGIALFVTSTAHAQGFEVAQEDSSDKAKPAILLSKPEIVTDALKKFDLKRTVIQDSLTSELRRPNFIADGVTLYSLKAQVGTVKLRFVTVDKFEIDVTENVLSFRLTKSDESDSSPKPSGEVRFNILVRGTMHTPTSETPQLAVTDATITIAKIAVKKGDVSGDAAASFEKVSDSIARMNKDRNVFRSAFDRYLRMEFNDQLNKGLRPINKKIAEAVKKGLNPSCSLNEQTFRVTMAGR